MAAALQLVIVEDSEADAELVSRHLAKAGVRAEIRRVQTEHDFVTALKTRRDLPLPDPLAACGRGGEALFGRAPRD